MRPYQATSSAKPGLASLGSAGLSNGSGSAPAWMGVPSAPSTDSASGTNYSRSGGNALSSSSVATAGDLSFTSMLYLQVLMMMGIQCDLWNVCVLHLIAFRYQCEHHKRIMEVARKEACLQS